MNFRWHVEADVSHSLPAHYNRDSHLSGNQWQTIDPSGRRYSVAEVIVVSKREEDM